MGREGKVKLLSQTAISLLLVDEETWATTSDADMLKVAAEFLDWAKKFEPKVRERIADDLHSRES